MIPYPGGLVVRSKGVLSLLPDSVSQLRQQFRNPRFWGVQGLVLFATAVHIVYDLLERASESEEIYFALVVMYGLHIVPVIYASLNFGQAGAIPTAIWSALLALPNTLLWHSGFEKFAEILEHVIIFALAVVIAGRVDREIMARKAAEASEASRRNSEAKYRALFEAAGEAILVFDDMGRIREANDASAVMFGAPRGILQSWSLDDLFGTDAAVLAEAGDTRAVASKELRWTRPDGSERWLEPVCRRVVAADIEVVQALFHDLTELRERQRGLESYARQTLVAQEEERRHIAHELHDGPLQELLLLCRSLDELDARQGGVEIADGDGLRRVRHEIETIAEELRRLSRDLRPSILDDLGLIPALRWLLTEMEQRTGIRASFISIGEERRFAAPAELAFFRIAQEALRNVERHARASEVVVALTSNEKEILLAVQDDGRGIAEVDLSSHAALAGRLGLLGMQERARLCGGTFTLSSAPDRGTRIEVVLKLPVADH